MLQIGDRFGQGLACKVVGEGLGTFGGITKAPLGLWLRQAAALPESLRVRMRQHPRYTFLKAGTRALINSPPGC